MLQSPSLSKKRATMSWRASWAILALCPALASCTIGPNYTQPDVPLASSYQSPPSNTATPADLRRYWVNANDAILIDLIDRALAQNLDLEAAAARLEQAGAGLEMARAALLPSGTVNGTYTNSYESIAAAPGVFLSNLPSGYPRNQENFALNGAASWEADIFGGTRRTNEAARANYAAASAGLAATQVAIVGAVATSYVQLRQVQAERALLNQVVVNQRRQNDLLKLLLQRGVIAGKDYQAALAGLADLEARVPVLRAAEGSLMNAIDVLLGEAPGSNHALLSPAAPIPSFSSIPHPGTPSDLLRRRPDVAAAEYRLRASNAQIGAAMGEYYPKLSLTGLLGVLSLSGGNLFSGDAAQARGTVGLRWRIFDFKRIDAEIAGARGQYREDLAAFRAVVLKAAQDVENALLDIDAATAVAVQRQKTLDARLSAQQSAQAALKRGAISRRAAIDADQAVLSARAALAQAKAAETRAVITLYRALGGGWDYQG